MRETITKVTGIVATCVCTVAMLLASVLVPQQHAAAADDDSSSTSKVSVPDYCGTKSVIMVTDSGEVYQVYTGATGTLPTTGDVTQNDGKVSAQCMIPLPYLPWNIKNESPDITRPKYVRSSAISSGAGSRDTYDALGSDTKTGDLWATRNTGTTTNMSMQVWHLTKEARESHASNPNPSYTKAGTSDSYWVNAGSSVKIGKAFASGGAVDKTDDSHYIAAVNPSQCYVNSNSKTVGNCSAYKTKKADGTYARVLKEWDIDFYSTNGGTPTKKGTLTLNIGEYAPSSQDSDIAFDDQGNLTLILSWYETGVKTSQTTRGGIRYVRKVHIPAANVQDGSFTPDSDTMVDTNTSLPISLKGDGYEDFNISGIGKGSSDSDLTVSLFNSYGLAGQSLYTMADDGKMTNVYTFAANPPHTTHSCVTSTSRSCMDLVDSNLWGGGSTSFTTASQSYGFYSGDITDIADGIGGEEPKEYTGNYQLTKVDATTGKALEGATFTLWPYNGTSCGNVPTTATGITLQDGNLTGAVTATSDENGLVSFSNILLGKALATNQTSKQFCLAESSVPEGYDKATVTSPITISPNTPNT